MRNLKKFLALVLAFMMAFSLMATAQADYDGDYTDRSEVSDLYGEAVDFLKGLGVFKGVPDEETGENNFRPDRPITRAEVCTVVYRMMTGDVEDKQVGIYTNYISEFKDIAGSANEWAAPYINYCANGLYVHGYPNNIFKPDREITGYQLLAIVLRCLGYGENGEFEGTGWETRTATTAQRLGITQNIARPLSENTTREEVAEILYRALQTETVKYTYTYEKVVQVAENSDNYSAYSAYLAKGGELPIYETLLYRNFQVVSSDNTKVAVDSFGRPSQTWYKDTGKISDGTKYVYDSGDTTKAFTLKYMPVAIYDNVITECDLATEVNNDKGFTADVYLNGVKVATDHDVDAVHTVDTYVNAPGRTLEIYHTNNDQWLLVMIDTFLGVVTNVTPHTEDTAGHLMQEAALTVGIGDNDGATVSANKGYMVKLTFTQAKDYTYSVGDLVLVQTANSDVAAFAANYADVPCDPKDFSASTDNSRLGVAPILVGGVKTVPNVTVKGTKGDATSKTGIETDQGVFWLSNVYMRGTVTDANSDHLRATPGAYYIEVANNLINRTFNLIMATINGVDYVVGMEEVGGVNVGVINSVEAVRAGSNKYSVSVDLTDFDGGSHTMEFLKQDKTYFDGQTKAEDATVASGDVAGTADPTNDSSLMENFLIAYETFTKDGKEYARIVATGSAAEDASTDTIDGDPIQASIDSADTNISTVLTGVTDTLSSDDDELVDDNTRFLIANYGPDYSAGSGNDGTMMPLGYKPFTGFKTIPTIYGVEDLSDDSTGADPDYADNKISDVLYTVLTYKDVRYVAIYAENDEVGYSMRGQETFAIDDSYLVVSTGTTYQYYSTYNVLKNGVLGTVNVASLNTDVNEAIDDFIATNKATITASTGTQLIKFTSKDASGNYTGIAQSEDKGHFNTQPTTTGMVADGTDYPSYKAGVLTVASGTYLTMAADAQVVIVNAAQGQTYPGTLSSIAQYASNTDGTASGGDDNAFVWELDSNGYISCLYIID